MNRKVNQASSNIQNGNNLGKNIVSKYGFGPHLMLDGYGCHKGKLSELSTIYQLLEELPAIIGMTKIMPPYVFQFAGPKEKPEDWGLSGFVLIAESHISIHTFPDKNYLSFDIFSCKPFHHEKAVQYLIDKFEIKDKEIHTLDRGLQFPHYASKESLNKGIVLANQERKEHIERIKLAVSNK